MVKEHDNHGNTRKGEPNQRVSVMDAACNGMARLRGASIYHGDSLGLYSKWDAPPTVIVSDGPYGLGMFDGDPRDADGLPGFYEPHITEWSRYAGPQTTLWFWNTEIGWATVHPLLERHGWRYVNCHVWNKGIAHIAGNVNTGTIRKFPVVTEVCVQYAMEQSVSGHTLKDWLRLEWKRTGLPFTLANEACGLKNAATRKYLTMGNKWYFPPADAFAKMASYANIHGNPGGRPYFSLDGKAAATAAEWSGMRPKFHCGVGITNVWNHPALHGSERLKAGQKPIHCNQKPLKLIHMIINASSDEGDVVWEPFGGLCTAAVVSAQLDRTCHSAEINGEFYRHAVKRLADLLSA